jgi:hypothetical protein
VRTDIPLADQVVQVGHACLEAGFKYPRPNEIVNLVLLTVASEKQLLVYIGRLGTTGIKYALFHEPDNQMGYTAACTEPLAAIHKREFRHLPLWKSSMEVIKA